MSELDWVDIANLKGPKGDEGPVNVGVSSVTAAGDKLRFGFTDGREPQDVALPLATSNSAGLQSATDKAKLDGITVDTSAGTRVFIGGVMVRGETGWRNISTEIQDDWTGTAYIKRVNDTVSVSANLLPAEHIQDVSRGYRRRILRLPTGFYGTGLLSYQGAGYGLAHGILIGIDMAWANYMLDVTSRSSENLGDLGTWGTRTFQVNYSFPVDSTWPTSLPGTPA